MQRTHSFWTSPIYLHLDYSRQCCNKLCVLCQITTVHYCYTIHTLSDAKLVYSFQKSKVFLKTTKYTSNSKNSNKCTIMLHLFLKISAKIVNHDSTRFIITLSLYFYCSATAQNEKQQKNNQRQRGQPDHLSDHPARPFHIHEPSDQY